MPNGVDWLDGGDDPRPDDGRDDDVLEVGRAAPGWVRRVSAALSSVGSRLPRLSRRTTVGLAVVTAAAAVVVAVAVGPGGTSDPAAVPISTAPTGDATLPAKVVGISAEQSTLMGVAALAGRRGGEVDYVRQTSSGSCPSVPPGGSPARAIARAAHAVLPAFTLRTATRTLDQIGLCAIELRSAPSSAGVLVLTIAAPSPSSRPQPGSPHSVTGAETTGGTTTRYASSVLPGGWIVVAGAQGTGADLPTTQALVDLSRRPELLW